MNQKIKKHWNTVYSSKSVEQLGWYEELPTISLKLIEHCCINKKDAILDIGTGASTLVNYLVEINYQQIIAVDISELAIEKLRTRLGTEKARQVQMLVDDITNPTELNKIRNITLRHDRAMLHFLITKEQQYSYLSVMDRVIKPGGYVIIAAFAKNGAAKCSGLDIRRYDEKDIKTLLGNDYELMESINLIYHMPSGDKRPYLYVRFQKTRSG